MSTAAAEELCSLRPLGPGPAVEVIDQTRLPHSLQWLPLDSLHAVCHAISQMQVRGAPLIGIAAAYGLALALDSDASDASLQGAVTALLATRPTAVNLRWALDRVRAGVVNLPPSSRAGAALALANQLRDADIASCAAIGEHGLAVLPRPVAGRPLQVMTHCNAGWLATVRWGTALAPLYRAHARGWPLHVWVSETRPRNQGMQLTAWELQRAGIPCTVVADNSCGLLMQQGKVDCVLVGSDRTAANGDVCNKVGTYLKALAAAAHGVPFHVALPVSTIDWDCAEGGDIPIEEREGGELHSVSGRDSQGREAALRLAAVDTVVANPAFDITPAGLVTSLVTELGVVAATAEGLASLRARVVS